MVRRTGFTLIELLLVLVIIGVITAVTIPEYVRSMRGNRLRTAARTVVAAGRYARSMAVLHQRAIAIDVEQGGNRLVIDAARPVSSTNRADASEFPMLDSPPESTIAPEPAAASPSGPGMNIRIERALDQVTIADVQHGGGGSLANADGRVSIVYQSNGLCTPYRVRLDDAEGSSMEIQVDALGSVEFTRRIAP